MAKPKVKVEDFVLPDAEKDTTEEPVAAPGEATLFLPDYRSLLGLGPGQGVFGVTVVGPNLNTGRPNDSIGFQEDIEKRGPSNAGFAGRDLYPDFDAYRSAFVGHFVVRDCGVAWLQYAAHTNPDVEKAWLKGPLCQRGLLKLLREVIVTAQDGNDKYPSLQALCQGILADLNLDAGLTEAILAKGDVNGHKLTRKGRIALATAFAPVRTRMPL